MRVLQAFKTSEMDAGLKGLEKNEIDILMKYIYRGFAQSSDSSSACLLAWHEKVNYQVFGTFFVSERSGGSTGTQSLLLYLNVHL